MCNFVAKLSGLHAGATVLYLTLEAALELLHVPLT